ncbi:KEOPS complex subunit Pcc1 [Vulcanisaeta souniana]|nr:KEOPS complex subunit Pcc1 [Vulcanisaeta souniana]
MRVKGKVTLSITMKTFEDCQAALLSLLPDERDLPPGLSSSIKCIGNQLIYELNYDIDSEKLLSIYNTVDDFIRNLRILMDSLNTPP